jgi:hypothetical protein
MGGITPSNVVEMPLLICIIRFMAIAYLWGVGGYLTQPKW